VFSVRVTVEERARLEKEKRRAAGPRGLGPWLIWRALSPARVVPGQPGQYPHVGSGAVLPDLERQYPSGNYPAGEVLPPPAAAIPARSRVILDLCAGSGSWSEPYAAAGYDVRRITLPGVDVREFAPEGPAWGVLAAPPCDQFSLARNGHDSPRDLERGLECVAACLRIIALARPQWWAIENPVGLLSRFLGTPRDVFEPCDFGDPWTKRTAIWGDFAIPERGPFVKPLGGGPLCRVCDPDRRKTTWCSNAAHRAVTPAGFAGAFFRANP